MSAYEIHVHHCIYFYHFKAKTFSASLAEKLADNQGSFASSSSKFDALAEYNEADIDKDINTAIVGTIDWWKASGKNGKASSNLTPTDDGFVRISLPNSSLIDQKISYVPKLTLDESNLSLRSLAEMFAGSSDKEGKSQENTNDVFTRFNINIYAHNVCI